MNYVNRLINLLKRPPKEIIHRILRKFNLFANFIYDYLKSLICSSYPSDQTLTNLKIQRHFSTDYTPMSQKDLNLFKDYISQILKHEFDLLGSGLTKVAIENTKGKKNKRSRFGAEISKINRSNRRWSNLYRSQISEEYLPIDWHTDFKSKFKWASEKKSKLLRYGVERGPDIKVPWELARFQHAPLMARYFQELLHSDAFECAFSIENEFRDQVFDFASQNPPGYGPNWSCTMDVAIRLVNWLVAYDMFLFFGAKFDCTFKNEFTRLVLAHGRHILSNLEYSDSLTSNHYLANLSGLFFASCYLSQSIETDKWFAFSSNELTKEAVKQFNADGSNFEGSTSYHLLSSEMLLYSIGLAQRVEHRFESVPKILRTIQFPINFNLPDDFGVFSGWSLRDKRAYKILQKAAFFSRAVTRPDGVICQFGDNDSGKFIRERPPTNKNKNPNHDSLISGADYLTASTSPNINQMRNEILIGLSGVNSCKLSGAKAQDSPLVCFNDFGLYIYRKKRVWIAIRCGSVGQNGNGGHAHNDQLSIELCFDQTAFLIDSGTFLYTPDPDSRNKFRRTSAHSTLLAKNQEQNKWLPGPLGLFNMTEVAKTRVKKINRVVFEGEHYGYSATHNRKLMVYDDRLEGRDICGASDTSLAFILAPNVDTNIISSHLCYLKKNEVLVSFRVNCGTISVVEGFVSPSYGNLIPNKILSVVDVKEECYWDFNILKANN